MNRPHPRFSVLAGCLLAACCILSSAQTPAPVAPPPVTQQPGSQTPVTQTPSTQTPAPAQQGTQGTDVPAIPKGTVLFQSHGEPPEPSAETPPQTKTPPSPEKLEGPELTESQRTAITVTGYDLDARIAPDSAHFAGRARVTLRNDGIEPLQRIALQVSSTLRWESIALVGPGGSTKLAFDQHVLDTDADHTGGAREEIAVLTEPLAPGGILTLDTFYSGTLPPSTSRLERIGATPEQSAVEDWDGISAHSIALRGFGNVLWYPVAARQLFLGEGAELFQAIGSAKLRNQGTTFRLHLGVEYNGNAPAAAYFCGRRQAFTAVSDNPEMPIAGSSGFASADFIAQTVGFRIPSLFVFPLPETVITPGAGSSSSSSSFSSSSSSSAAEPAVSSTARGAALLAVESEDEGAIPALTAHTQRVAPLLAEWLGERPLSALTILDHAGQPFEDGPLLVAPLASLAVSTAEPAIAHSLTHAWIQTGDPWMDEGLAQFFALLAVAREDGRDASTQQLQNLMQPVGIAEPVIEQGKPAPAGQPLIAASSEIFFRRKAAAVWWMLRTIAGDKPLQLALQSWRLREPSNASAEENAVAFEAVLEKASGKDLHWFFDDWVLHDRGLPDLSIQDVTPRELPAVQGHDNGWLVSVTVHNEGAAAAEVPVTVHSGRLVATSPLRVPGFGNATARIVVEAIPTEVSVNDGTTPEVTAWLHTRTLVAQPAK